MSDLTPPHGVERTEVVETTELTQLDLTYGRLAAVLDVVRTISLVVIAAALVVLA